jgi:hypothetical protein
MGVTNLISQDSIKRNAIAFQGRLALVKFVSCQELVDWAIAALEEGYESPSLVILAGLTDLDSLEEVRSYFRKSLCELDLIVSKDPKIEIANYAIEICKQILNNQISIFSGHQILYQIWLKTNDYSYPNLNSDKYVIWMYLQDSLELVNCGYGPLLPQFEVLNDWTYEFFVRQEAIKFLAENSNSFII